MREIKFRAWNQGKNRSRWLKSHEFAVKPDGEVIFKVEDSSLVIEDEQSVYEFNPLVNIILMQYTGLKDKNGKEIYEGDIIKYKYLHEDYIATVRFDERLAHFNAYEYAHGEVIGNIFENERLLE